MVPINKVGALSSYSRGNNVLHQGHRKPVTILEPRAETAPAAQAETTPAVALLSPVNWIDQDPVLREMWLRNESCEAIAEALGRSTAAIMTRAARLGLPRRAAPGRKSGYKRADVATKPRTTRRATDTESASKQADQGYDVGQSRFAQPVPAMRVCLMCLNKFQSQGAHNRICSSCKGSSQYAAASGLPEMGFKVEH